MGNVNTYRLPVFRLPEKTLIQWKAGSGCIWFVKRESQCNIQCKQPKGARLYGFCFWLQYFGLWLISIAKIGGSLNGKKKTETNEFVSALSYKALLSNKGGLYDEVGAIIQRLAVWLKGKSLYFLGDVGGVRQPET